MYVDCRHNCVVGCSAKLRREESILSVSGVRLQFFSVQPFKTLFKRRATSVKVGGGGGGGVRKFTQP